MRILIVAKYNAGHFSPFVMEQIFALRDEGVEVDTYGIEGKGVFGYLDNIKGIKRKVHKYRPDLIHAHYGLSGLCANLQRRIPVITTYHGSDVHSGGWLLILSQIAMRLSAYNIFVSRDLLKMAGYKQNNSAIIPCGVSFNDMPMIDRDVAKKEIKNKSTIVLFAGAFTNEIKNAILAKEVMKYVPNAELIEMAGYSRRQINILMNAADCLLMTSHREGSPQVIKEAMACGTPIVSVDVGDVKEVIGNTMGCFIAERNANDIAEKVKQALALKEKTNGRKRIIGLGLSNDLVAKKIVSIYNDVLKKVADAK